MDLHLAPDSAPTGVPLGDLVNPHGIRSAVRRLFTGGLDEILGELFQLCGHFGAVNTIEDSRSLVARCRAG